MKPDIESFLSEITNEEFAKLGDLIMTDNIDGSLDLSCELVHRHLSHIPKTACIHYCEYILYLIKKSVKEYFNIP